MDERSDIMNQPDEDLVFNGGARHEVDVLHVQSCHKISVRLKNMRERYFEIEKELNVWCSDHPDKKLVNFKVGTLCCVKLPRACYRGKILRTDIAKVSTFLQQYLLNFKTCV